MLVFDGITNPKTGTTAAINTGPIVVAKTLAGPDFAKEAYTDGFVQFADAVQRAEFQPVRRTNWYTVLNPPTMFGPVKIHVPSSVAEVFQLPDGKIFCLLDITFLGDQLTALLSSEPLTARQLRIYLISNTFLFENDAFSLCHQPRDTTAALLIAVGRAHRSVLNQSRLPMFDSGLRLEALSPGG